MRFLLTPHMARILRLSVLCVVLTSLSGCYRLPAAMKPAGFIFNQMPENAPENFKKGWVDGCTTGASTMTNSFYRWFYRFTVDKELMNDPVYYATWKDTSTFCRHYVYGLLREGDGRTRLPNNMPSVVDRFAGTKDFFNSGILHFWSVEGTNGMMIQNWGETAGNGNQTTDSAFTWDYSSTGAFTGHTQTFSNDSPLFFTPKHSIVPY